MACCNLHVLVSSACGDEASNAIIEGEGLVNQSINISTNIT